MSDHFFVLAMADWHNCGEFAPISEIKYNIIIIVKWLQLYKYYIHVHTFYVYNYVCEFELSFTPTIIIIYNCIYIYI